MSDQASEISSIPRETVRSAKAVFGPGNFYIQVGEHLGVILEDINLDCFNGIVRNSGTGGAILPLVTFFEFVESLTDDQAVDAVRTRMDWKYALHLPVNPQVFHQNVLCEFRRQVAVNPAGQSELHKLVDRLIPLNPPINKLFQNFEVLTFLSTVCLVNRLNWIGQAMQQTLGALAVNHPVWLRQIALPHWYGRFNNLSSGSKPGESVREYELSMEELGADIHHLLEEVHRSNFGEISEMREIKALHRIWEQQFENGGGALSAQSGTSKWINCDSCRYYAG
jgi:transposase